MKGRNKGTNTTNVSYFYLGLLLLCIRCYNEDTMVDVDGVPIKLPVVTSIETVT